MVVKIQHAVLTPPGTPLYTGLLYFDNGKRPFALKVASAANAYDRRMPHHPTTCFINPDLWSELGRAEGAFFVDVPYIGHIEVLPNRNVQPNNFFLCEVSA